MNVAYILHSTSRYDGATKAFLLLLKGLQQLGVSPCIVLPDKKGIYQDLLSQGFDILCCPFRSNSYPHYRTWKEKLLFLPKLIARRVLNRRARRGVMSFLVKNDVDIVHTNVGVVDVGFQASRKLGIPHVYHIREYANRIGINYYPSNASFLHQLSQKGSFSICITKDMQCHYRLQNNETSEVIYDAIHTGKVNTQELPREFASRYFLFAGRLQPVKGLDFVLYAYAKYKLLSSNPLPLYVAGEACDALYYVKLQQIIKQERLTSDVIFIGQRSDLDSLMRKAQAIVIASTFEGFGLCMPEAMLNDCLALARNNSGTREQLDNGLQLEGEEIALRFESIDELSELLKQVGEKERDAFIGIREHAFHAVSTLYSPLKTASDVFEFYNKICNRQ